MRSLVEGSVVSVAQRATERLVTPSWGGHHPLMPALTTVPRRSAPPPAALGSRLRQARTGLGLSLREAAEALDRAVSAATLCRIEKGERDITSEPVLTLISERFDIPRDELAELAGEVPAGAVRDLLSADMKLAVRGGRLHPAARRALRAAHLEVLAGSRADLTLRALTDEIDLNFRAVDEPPG